jgi:hypothetical protein
MPRKGGHHETVIVKVDDTSVEMTAPLRADEPPRAKCDEDMLLACIEFMKFRIDSIDDVFVKRYKTSNEAKDEQAEKDCVDDDEEPDTAGDADGVDDGEEPDKAGDADDGHHDG